MPARSIRPPAAGALACLALALVTGCADAPAPVPASCSDGSRNGSESDVDCGGSCDRCALDRTCVASADCASGICVANVCVECAAAADCPAVATECGTPACVDGRCGSGLATAGSAARTQVAGDCHTRHCDTAGEVSDDVDDADVPFDGNPCTADVCTSGTPANPPEALGLPCGTAAGFACSGGGTCVVDTTVVAQPEDATVTAPDPATFSVTAAGGSALGYQWQLNGTDIPGATSPTLTTSETDFYAFSPSSTFVYTVRISGASTAVTSHGAHLVVVAPNPTYPAGGDPRPAGDRALTVLPSATVDAVHFPNGSFRFGYDESLKDPVWTAYADFRVSATLPNADRVFQPDLRLAYPQVVGGDMGRHGTLFFLDDGQGFDRGHMVMMSDVSYRYGPGAGSDATMMSNIVPQVSYLNQRLWLQLEDAVGGGSGDAFDNGLSAAFGRVWIYSGPVFTGTTQYWVPAEARYTTDPSTVPASVVAIAIPTAMYKILVVEAGEGAALPRALAWVCSNRSYSTTENVDVWKYVTSVARVEELTGLDFFPDLPHFAELAAWKSTVDVRGWGADFEKASGPNVHVLTPSWDLVPITTNPVLTGETATLGDPVPFVGAAEPCSTGGSLDPSTDCRWTFGDGSAPVTGATTTHTFGTAGTFSATFACTDDRGRSNSISRTVVVVSGP